MAGFQAAVVNAALVKAGDVKFGRRLQGDAEPGIKTAAQFVVDAVVIVFDVAGEASAFGITFVFAVAVAAVHVAEEAEVFVAEAERQQNFGDHFGFFAAVVVFAVKLADAPAQSVADVLAFVVPENAEQGNRIVVAAGKIAVSAAFTVIIVEAGDQFVVRCRVEPGVVKLPVQVFHQGKILFRHGRDNIAAADLADPFGQFFLRRRGLQFVKQIAVVVSAVVVL